MNRQILTRLEELEEKIIGPRSESLGVVIVPEKKGKLDTSKIDWDKHPRGVVILPQVNA